MALTACKILGKNAKEAVPPIAELLTESSDDQIRWNAARTLGSIGPFAASAVPELTAALERDPDLVVRWWAAKALGAIGPAATSAIPQLTKAMKNGSAVAMSLDASKVSVPTDAAAEALVALGVNTNTVAAGASRFAPFVSPPPRP
jgi:HEAT repeat protein